MDSFEYYIKKGKVKRAFPNKQRIKKLIRDGEKRIADVQLLDTTIFPKFVFENIYDAIRDFLFAILLNDGYKTTSHEAPISYLLNKGFDIYTVNVLDKFRYKRNGSKYYGEEVSIEEAKTIKAFCDRIKNRLDNLLREIKNE